MGRLIGRVLQKHVVPYLRRDFCPRSMPIRVRDWILRAPFTWGFAAIIVLLHIARLISPAAASLYESGAFVAGRITWSGVALCGFFHQSLGHFFANLGSFLFCSLILEVAAGTGITFLVMGLGLWLSNPLTVLALNPLLSVFLPEQLPKFLVEVDYGASNGIYALVGAMAALLSRPKQLIHPFIFNGLLFALATSSWLAAQHLFALALGYFASRIRLRRIADPDSGQELRLASERGY